MSNDSDITIPELIEASYELELQSQMYRVTRAMRIRELLMSYGEMFIEDLYRALRDMMTFPQKKPPTYQSVRRMVYLLRRLGLVKISRTMPTSKPHKSDWDGIVRKKDNLRDRIFIKANPDKLYDSGWINPQKALYGVYESQKKFYESKKKGKSEESKEHKKGTTTTPAGNEYAPSRPVKRDIPNDLL